MGRYNRKSERQSWNEVNMRNAVEAVQDGRMGWLLASKTYNVPFTTLRRRARKNDWKKGYLGGFKTTFNKELEQEIVRHLQNLESRFFGLTTVDVRKLAYEVAEKKGLKHKFSRETKMAGWDWLNGFRKRNPSISLRTPEATSAARASAFNKQQIKKYFQSLSAILNEFKFQPNEIWNVDESGLSTVPSKNIKIFATRGRKQVGILSSAERGQHFTVVCCMNAAGTFVPPAIIFPRKNMKNELMDGAPVGSVAFCQETGWMNGEIFLKWMKHFVKFVKPSLENKVLLILDGHVSHKSLEVLTYAKENGIIIFCLPPHCTHRVQPLDVSFYSPLTSYYNQELSNWLRNHPGRVITHYQVAQLFNNAYVKAASIRTAQSGFSATGISPFNPNVFPEWMFAPSTVTELPEHSRSDPEQPEATANAEETNTSNVTEKIKEPLRNDFRTENVINVVNTNNNTFEYDGPSTSKAGHNISVAEIFPLPLASQEASRPRRKKGSFGFINSTPELDMIKAAVAEKEAMTLRKAARFTKKKLNEDEDVPLQSIQRPRPNKKFARNSSDDKNNSSDAENDNSGDDDETACIYCNELYHWSRSRELWFKCQNCGQWAHAECAGLNSKAKTFICDICC